MQDHLKAMMGHFRIEGNFLDGRPYGSGHIHDTFLIRTGGDVSPDYLLQRINHKVFTNVPRLMHNIECVTRYIGEQLAGTDPNRENLTLIPAQDGNACYKDPKGNYWRVYIFIKNSRFYDKTRDARLAYEGGKAFGRFQSLLSNFPPEKLYETIPDFHNIEKRVATFFSVVKKDPLNRAQNVKKEILKIEERGERMKKIMALGKAGKIPLRVTHNDTKLNNVLFDKKNRALCVVDLDTVMPGYIHYDFGDAIRTMANTGVEDEKDLSRVRLDIHLFETLTKGFLEQTGHSLNSHEKESLVFAPKLLTFMMGVRFLTDYIEGDTYYKTHFADHNLQRARTQFKLLSSMDEQTEDMHRIIQNQT